MNEDNNGKCNEINTSLVCDNNTSDNADGNAEDNGDKLHMYWKKMQLKALQIVQSLKDNKPPHDSYYAALLPMFEQIIKHPNFTANRSPFFCKEKRYCLMPVISQKRIHFQVSINNEDVNIFNNKDMEQTKVLHLRLFNFINFDYQAWNTSQCDVSINDINIKIAKTNRHNDAKQKGYYVSPLDVTKEVCRIMDFDITSHGQFSGALLLEVVHICTTDSLCQRIKNRFKPIDKQHVQKKCEICYKKSKLLTCSRCKCVWYCGVKHQVQDLSYHQMVCSPKIDDFVYDGPLDISLRCPLSTAKIQTPIRGTNCLHSQCIDLKTFLLFSHDTGVWQCPVCLNPLTFNQIFIDNKMNDILKQIH
eukprot:187253_1